MANTTVSDIYPFTHYSPAQRVLFGTGLARHNLRHELNQFQSPRPFLVVSGSSRSHLPTVCDGIDHLRTYDEVMPHVPVETARRARQAAQAHGANILVALGGGSAIGLAKAIALQDHYPILAIPTTYAGSEATNVWGITDARHKQTGTDEAVRPQSIIYDADLTEGLAPAVRASSGVNALAHGIDAMWAPQANPINRSWAIEGIRALATGLPQVCGSEDNVNGRELSLYGAYLAASAFSSAGSGLHHKICHVLGGAYDLPHAHTHAIILPHVLAFNAAAFPEAERRIAYALGASCATGGLSALLKRLNTPASLTSIGFDPSSIAAAAELIVPYVPTGNPRPVSRADIEAILCAAC